jgi:hypothetical protein
MGYNKKALLVIQQGLRNSRGQLVVSSRAWIDRPAGAGSDGAGDDAATRT